MRAGQWDGSVEDANASALLPLLCWQFPAQCNGSQHKKRRPGYRAGSCLAAGRHSEKHQIQDLGEKKAGDA